MKRLTILLLIVLATAHLAVAKPKSPSLWVGSLKVEQMMEFESHLLFICEITEAKVFNNVQTMTYNYYQANVKPKPKTEIKGWVCDTCGYRGCPSCFTSFKCPKCTWGHMKRT